MCAMGITSEHNFYLAIFLCCYSYFTMLDKSNIFRELNKSNKKATLSASYIWIVAGEISHHSYVKFSTTRLERSKQQYILNDANSGKDK